MANYVYPEFMKHLFSGTIDLLNDTIYVALVSGSYVPSTGHRHWNDVLSHQAHDPLGSYVSGGKALQGRTLSVNYSTSQVVYDASDVTWTTATITASGAVIWYSGSNANRYLVAFQDLGGNQTSTNGTFSVVWNNSNGIFRLGAS